MPSRNLAPMGKVEHLRETLETFAKEHGLLIFEKNSFKIDWMAEHQGKCFCDWQNRTCPCQFLFEDLAKFKGNCLCAVFVTTARANILNKPRKTKVRTQEEERGYKEIMKQKQKQNLVLYDKLFKKKKKGY